MRESRKPAFSRALGAAPERLHFAAHSHHPWPDVTLKAQEAYWQDSARRLDDKWEHIFGTVRPAAQAHVARVLNLSDPDTVTFSGNTHDFLCRILSCLPTDQPLRVLSSDSEFHSFSRQMARLAEDGLVVHEQVPARPFETFTERFASAAANGTHDLVYLSQTFFNSGYRLETDELESIARAIASPETFYVIDGYHSFLADPVDFSRLEARAFFLSGGYKYVMAGEGVCFLHAPAGYGPRPRQTGWYAAFSALSGNQSGRVPYAPGAARFDGATFDPSGLYRFNAVMDWLTREGLGVADMAAYVRALQIRFLDALRTTATPLDPGGLMVDPSSGRCGRFLTFEQADAGRLYEDLHAAGIVTDVRKDRLRFGFGIYHDAQDVERLVTGLSALTS